MNLAHTRAQGLELSLEARPVPQLSLLRPVHAAGRRDPREPERLRSASTPSGSRCCAGRSTRARSRRQLSRPALERRASRWRSSASGRTATSWAWASTTNPGLRPARRPAARAVRRERSRRSWSADNLLDARVPGGAGLPGARPLRARRAAAAARRRRAPVSDERVLLAWSSGKDSAFALHVLRAQGVAVAGLLTTINEAYDRVAMHAVRLDLLRAQAEAVGLPLVEVRIPSPCPNEAYEAAMARRWPTPARAASPRSPSATCSSRTCGATARSASRRRGCGRCSRSGAGRRARWPRR